MAGSIHYREVENTVWPVNVRGIEWELRYGAKGNHKLVAASVVAAYAALIDPTLSEKDAIAKLRRARRAQREAQLPTGGSLEELESDA
jgi:hypothetical protein